MQIVGSKIECTNWSGRLVIQPSVHVDSAQKSARIAVTIHVGTREGIQEITIDYTELKKMLVELEREVEILYKAVDAVISALNR